VSEFLSSIIATFVTIPLFGYIIVFVITKIVTKQHRKAVRIALDFTTLLIIMAVHYFIKAIWGTSYLWLILLIMILIAIVFVIIHWKVKHEIHFAKVFKGFWRFSLLLFGIAYTVLLLYGLILRVNMSITML
jgi:hypothetical protein